MVLTGQCCCFTLVKYNAATGARTWERRRRGADDPVDAWILLDASNDRIYTTGAGGGSGTSGQCVTRWNSTTTPVRDWCSDPMGWVGWYPGQQMALGTDGYLWAHDRCAVRRFDISDGSQQNERDFANCEVTRIHVGPSADAYAVLPQFAGNYGNITRLDSAGAALPSSHTYSGTSTGPLIDGVLVGSNMIAALAVTSSNTKRYVKLDTSLAESANYDASGESSPDDEYDAAWIEALSSTAFIARESRSGQKRLAKYSIASMTQDWTTTTDIIGSADWGAHRYATDGTDFYIAEHQPTSPTKTIRVQCRAGSDGSVTWEAELDAAVAGGSLYWGCVGLAATDNYVVVIGHFCSDGDKVAVVGLDKSDGSVAWVDEWYNDGIGIGASRFPPLHVIDGGGDVAYVCGYCADQTEETCTTTDAPTSTYATTTTQPPTSTYATTTTGTTTTGTTTTAATTPEGGCGTSCTWVWDGSSWTKISDDCEPSPPECACPNPVGSGTYVGQTTNTFCGAD